MTQSEFVEKLKIALNVTSEMEINADTVLATIPEYDSLGIVCVITMFADEFGVNTDYAAMENMKTVSDLMVVAGIK